MRYMVNLYDKRGNEEGEMIQEVKEPVVVYC